MSCQPADCAKGLEWQPCSDSERVTAFGLPGAT